MPNAVINVRPAPNGKIARFNRIARKGSDNAYMALHDRVLLFAPRDEARPGYFGTAVLRAIELDVTNPSFLLVDLVDIRPFDESVPLVDQESRPYEADADRAGKELRWRYYSLPVRELSDSIFDTILETAGVVDGSFGGQVPTSTSMGLLELPAERTPIIAPDRPSYELSQRLSRSARLRSDVLDQYGPICAVTDRCLVSPQGVAEVEVCHIWPLAAGGPDIVRNALPMTRTVHWGFDLGLVSFSHDGTILIAQAADADFRACLNSAKAKANFAKDLNLWPDPDYIEYHRLNIFQGA